MTSHSGRAAMDGLARCALSRQNRVIWANSPRKLIGMNDLNRPWLGLALLGSGSALLASPIRRHRAVWHVTVGDKPARTRVLHGGDYIPSVHAMLRGLRTGERRPDAELRSALGLGLIGLGFGVSLIRGES